MVDTSATEKVASSKPKKPRMYPFVVELTLAEGEALETLHLYQDAENDPVLRAELDACQLIRLFVGWRREGRYTLADAAQHDGKDNAPALFAAVVTIADLFPLFMPEIREETDAPGEGEGAG